MTVYITKLASEDEDWTFDWTPKGASSGDPISSFTVAASVPEGLATHSLTHTETATTVWFSGGAAGIVYRILLTVVTSLGRNYAENVQVTIC